LLPGNQLRAGESGQRGRAHRIPAAAKKLPAGFVADIFSKQRVNLVESHLFPVPCSNHQSIK
jgi:hypothetical protein